jgi:methionyl-tRNA synthetase
LRILPALPEAQHAAAHKLTEVSVRNLTVLVLLACVLPISSSSAQFPTTPRNQNPQVGNESEKDPMEEKMEHQREKALNKQRQTQLQKDTDHLLELATQLKEYVDKSNEHTLSLDVVKKADEIEKLAKSVKEKMKGSY